MASPVLHDPQASLLCFARLRQNIASFYPHLLGGFIDLVQALGGPMGAAGLSPGDLEILSALVLGTEQILLDRRAVWIAWQRQELPAFAQALTSLHESGPNSAGAFVRLYPGLDHPLDAVHGAVLEFARSPAPRMDAKARLIAWAFAIPLPQDRHAFLRGFADLAQASPGIVDRVAKTLDRHFPKRPVDDLKSWLIRGFSLVRAGRTDEASDFLCLQSRESRSLLGLKGALLREEREILRIYTASQCSKGLNIQSYDVSSFGVGRPYTDGQSVYLPAEISLFTDNDLNRRSYAALTALISALVTGGTYGFSLEAAPFRNALADRYGASLPDYKPNILREYGGRIKNLRERRGNVLELVFKSGRALAILETDIEKFYYCFPAPHFARLIFTLLELTRVEGVLCRKYPGLAQDMNAMNRGISRLVPPVQSEDPRFVVFLTLVRRLYLLRLGRAGSGDTPGNPAGSATGASRLQHQMDKLFQTVGALSATVQTSAATTFALYNLFADAFPLTGYAGTADPLLDWDFPLAPDLAPPIVADSSPELFPTHKERAYFDLEDEKAKDVDILKLTEQEKKAENLREEIRSKAVRLFAYPEYDVNQSRYLPRACMVYERVLEQGDKGWYDGVIRANRQIQTRIVKKFLAMQPEEVELTRRWYDGDDIHLGDAVDFAVDLLRGATADDRIYQRKTVNVRDVAIQILVDASSSTKVEVGGRSIISLEKTALVLLSSALYRIGDTFSIAAYNSSGADKVFFYTAKDFAEPWTQEVRSRIDSMEPSAANRDGCAIRHATARLEALDNKTKILLLLSDGIPADPGYGDSDGIRTSEYALEDTRRAILEARRSGIIPFCLTIDEDAKDYIGHLYGDYNYSVLSDLRLLPQRLAKLYIKLTR